MTKPDYEKFVRDTIHETCRVKKQVAETMAADIASAAQLMAEVLRAGGRVLACGNGGSAADAQHLSGELVGRFLKDREPYAAIALSTDTSVISSIANDFGFDAIFEKQVRALGRPGDVLLAISTSGNSRNVLKAADAAGEIGMKTVALTGQGGGSLADKADILLAVPSTHTPRIQESHSTIVHLLCEIIENILTA